MADEEGLVDASPAEEDPPMEIPSDSADEGIISEGKSWFTCMSSDGQVAHVGALTDRLKLSDSATAVLDKQKSWLLH